MSRQIQKLMVSENRHLYRRKSYCLVNLKTGSICIDWCILAVCIFRGCMFSCSVISNSHLRPHELQHARLPCPSPSPRACTNSCPLSCWCHPTISFSVVHFLPSIVPSIGSFLMSQLVTSGGQSIGASASVLPVNIQDWFSLGLTGLTLSSPRDSQASSSTPQFKNISSLALSLLYAPTLTSIHDYWKNHNFGHTDLCQ